jgi:hypothetical protein
MRKMDIEGRCQCGRIAYEARVNPAHVVLCHCTDCQANSGGPCRANAPAPLEHFRLTGQPKTYVKTGASGALVQLSFCGDCGSALFSNRLEDPAYVNLRLGAVKQRAQLPPKAQYWCEEAMPWVMDLAAIPQSPDQRPAR